MLGVCFRDCRMKKLKSFFSYSLSVLFLCGMQVAAQELNDKGQSKRVSSQLPTKKIATMLQKSRERAVARFRHEYRLLKNSIRALEQIAKKRKLSEQEKRYLKDASKRAAVIAVVIIGLIGVRALYKKLKPTQQIPPPVRAPEEEIKPLTESEIGRIPPPEITRSKMKGVPEIIEEIPPPEEVRKKEPTLGERITSFVFPKKLPKYEETKKKEQTSFVEAESVIRKGIEKQEEEEQKIKEIPLTFSAIEREKAWDEEDEEREQERLKQEEALERKKQQEKAQGEKESKVEVKQKGKERYLKVEKFEPVSPYSLQKQLQKRRKVLEVESESEDDE